MFQCSCGQMLNMDWMFCPNCGYKFKAGQVSNVANSLLGEVLKIIDSLYVDADKFKMDSITHGAYSTGCNDILDIIKRKILSISPNRYRMGEVPEINGVRL